MDPCVQVPQCGEAFREKGIFFGFALHPHRFGARLALGGREQMLLLSHPPYFFNFFT
jgi:hypothetical protein